MRSIRRRFFVPLLALVCAVSLTACPGKTIQPLPSTPEVIDTVEQIGFAGAAKALKIIGAASLLMEQVVIDELDLAGYDVVNGVPVKRTTGTALIPDAQHQTLKGLFAAYVAGARKANDAIRKGAVTDWPTLRTTVDPLLTAVSSLVQVIQSLAAPGREGIWSLVRSVADIINTIWPKPSGGLVEVYQ